MSTVVPFRVRGYCCFIMQLLIWILLSPLTNSSPAPTSSPTIVGPFCNVFDGTYMDNPIQATYNTKISDLTISDPLRIKFNANLYSVDMCTTVDCNLIQFGISDSTVLFPRVSIQNVTTSNKTQNSFTWHITLQINTTSKDIFIQQNFTFPGTTSFDISFSGQTALILIGSKSHTQNITWIQNAAQLSGLYPFYVSSGDCCEVDSFNATLTELCVSTSSAEPSPSPTTPPTLNPSTLNPTETPISVASYTKILCYTETGTNGSSTVGCTEPDYIPTSCGVQYSASTGVDPYNNTFMRGWYIERLNPNQVELDPICHINYGNTADSIKSKLTPQARCCDFKQQYGSAFQCRYFNSVDELTDERYNNSARSSAKGASKANEVSYVTCDKTYPLLLGCTPYIYSVDVVPNGTDHRFVAGTFVAQGGADTTDTNYNGYFSLFNDSVAFPPTTLSPATDLGAPTSSPTNQPILSPTQTLYFNFSSNAQCVVQYGSTTYNYSLMAVATCCTENYKNETTDYVEPTPGPTGMPTIPPVLNTEIYGRGVNLGGSFSESGDGPIIGITTWGIVQVNDWVAENDPRNIPYQGLLIHEYQRYISNESAIKTIIANSDYGSWWDQQYDLKDSCASFEVDVVNGTRDYINGFDLFWTRFAIFGVRFRTKFGRIYSCPDDQSFVDTSIDEIIADFDYYVANLDPNDEDYPNVRRNDYNMSNVSFSSLFDANGSYELSGFQGTKQTRELNFGLERSVMATMGFIFLLDTGATSAPTSAPTQSPTPEPTTAPTLVPVAPPTYPGQSPVGSEKLDCYAIWGKSNVQCLNDTTDVMTSCHGYSANDQVLSVYIEDSADRSVCNAEGMLNQSNVNVAANAICCRFYVAPARDFTIFKWVAISGGTLYLTVLLGIGIHWFFWERHKKYFKESEIDKDTKIDDAWVRDADGEQAQQKVDDFGINRKEHNDLVELMAREESDSIGLQ